MATAPGRKMEICRLTTLPAEVRTRFVAESTAEGFHFVQRLARAWDAGATRFDGAGEVLLGVYEGPALLAVGGLTPDPYGTEAGVGRLRHVYVCRSARRRGVGRGLVRALEREAIGAYHAVVLRTDTPDAARFYEALGYSPLSAGGTATHRREVGRGVRVEPAAI